MAKKRRRVVAWQWPPRSQTKSLRTTKTFPGISLAEKGAKWLNMSLPSDYRLEERKVFAKICFGEAIKRCSAASLRAKSGNKLPESLRLAEIASWLEKQYYNTL